MPERKQVSGTTRLVGVMGWPIAHSLSPRMHNAAFKALGLDWIYLALPVRPDRLARAVRGLAALGFAGGNITVPHKRTVLPLLDELTPVARAVGAANTIVVRQDGTLLGDNTDGVGFLADLHAHAVRPERALVLGAGGAARAIAYVLAETGTAVSIVARDLSQAEAVCESLVAALPGAEAHPVAGRLPEDVRRLASHVTLVVNATSLGLKPGDAIPWDTEVPFHAEQAVYDLIYSRPTPLLAAARSDGAVGINGSGMLVHQGARAFELWTGQPAPVEVMRQALALDGGEPS